MPNPESEICVPTLETECEEKTVELKAPVEMERCLTIPMISCKAEVRKKWKGKEEIFKLVYFVGMCASFSFIFRNILLCVCVCTGVRS